MEQSAEFNAVPGDLRENITLKNLDLGLFEPGNVLKIGQCQIRLTFHCEPCKRIKHIVPSYDKVIGKRGVLGVIIQSGSISIDDAVVVEEKGFEPLSPVNGERFKAFLQQVPEGRVVTYADVTVGMGVADSFIRAIPGYISRADQARLPVHRIVDARGCLISSVANQHAKLRSEGVPIKTGDDFFGEDPQMVDLDLSRWTDGQLYLE
ncbi:MGMT family protein [Prosthecobacter sp.]|uniref:MGMT family protein n=1 Tax=Prosthecobacter sp. TaxID=1965333 RepID=UPI0037834969